MSTFKTALLAVLIAAAGALAYDALAWRLEQRLGGAAEAMPPAPSLRWLVERGMDLASELSTAWDRLAREL